MRRNVVKGISNALRRQNEDIMPHVGGAVGSLLSYGAIRTVGKLARNYYRPKGPASRMRALANR